MCRLSNISPNLRIPVLRPERSELSGTNIKGDID